MSIHDVHHIELPETTSLQRKLRTTKVNRGTEPLGEKDLIHYDQKTLLYDIFFDPSNRFLTVVGPPLLNLSPRCTPITVSIEGRVYTLSFREFIKNRILIGKIRVRQELPETCRVTVCFGNMHRWEGSVEKSTVGHIPRILCTIQKDNRIEWIRDWASYYHKTYDIDAVFIYDNNSSNFSELRSLSEAMPSVTLIPWRAPYGTYRSHGNKFAQTGALNHCRLKYGPNSRFFNFDIDELLVIPPGHLEKRLLHAKSVQFGQYHVPAKPELSDRCCSFSSYSTRLVPGTMFNQKYVCNTKRILVNHVHKNKHGPLRLFTALDKAVFRLAEAVRLPRWCMERLPYQEVPLSEGFLLHYKGITTGWSTGRQRPSPEEEEFFSPFCPE
ncbi:MAG: glycosyltransferase family 92 protein [Fibrobacterota bacterium]